MTSVVHVISGLGMGGAERNLVQLATRLQSCGFSQHVACVGGLDMWADELLAQGIGVTTLGAVAMLDAPFGVLRLSSLIGRLTPRVLQGWMYHGDLFAALAHRLASGRESRRLFWNLRASNTDQAGYGSIVAINARLSSWPDLVIANSHAGFEFHVAQGYRPRRSEVIPNGIETEKFRPDPLVRLAVRSELGISNDAVVAIHVARVNPMKDHAVFLKAVASLPDIRGLLVGAGTESLPLPNNVRALGLRRDVERLYACADLVVSTSAYAEGFSNVISEGMSAGLVPIATDVGDARTIIGDTGHIIPARDANALMKALAVETPISAAERRARGLRARARIVERFTLDQAAERYERLYREES